MEVAAAAREEDLLARGGDGDGVEGGVADVEGGEEGVWCSCCGRDVVKGEG
jgi:hypothetical protein